MGDVWKFLGILFWSGCFLLPGAPSFAETKAAIAITSVSASQSASLQINNSTNQGFAIFEEADRRANGYADSRVALEMILRDRRGRESRRELNISQLEVPEDGDRTLVIFETPKAVRGTALLSYAHKVADDDQWLYLPAFKRVKKISARNKSGPFLSSEFAFEDLTPQELNRYLYRYIGEENLDGQACYIVERLPVDEFSGYTRQKVWIDQAEYRVHRIDYFDRREELLKTLRATDFRLYLDQYWRAHHMAMINHKTGKSTELIWSDYEFQLGLSAERDFSTNSLLRVQ